ncbi:unnamed protein product, partial [Mycena citricolor]
MSMCRGINSALVIWWLQNRCLWIVEPLNDKEGSASCSLLHSWSYRRPLTLARYLDRSTSAGLFIVRASFSMPIRTWALFLSMPPSLPSSSSTPASDPVDVDHRKRRRNRTTHSCLHCHTTKRMCDRKRPCSRCTRLGLTGNCV